MIHLVDRLTYGRKFRDKSGQLVRYVYSNRKKIGLLVLLAADVIIDDEKPAVKKTKGRGGIGPLPNPLFLLE